MQPTIFNVQHVWYFNQVKKIILGDNWYFEMQLHFKFFRNHNNNILVYCKKFFYVEAQETHNMRIEFGRTMKSRNCAQLTTIGSQIIRKLLYKGPLRLYSSLSIYKVMKCKTKYIFYILLKRMKINTFHIKVNRIDFYS